MGKALYRSYRSTSFDEVLGQEHITTTLKNALKNGHVSHAYLLTGPRGVGKTSVARILAHAVNGLEYSHDNEHIDIIEIDAASNRRIDEIRELRERVMIAPASAKYKVYIIDEVHMLTREAFNALLKTLEEPPAHVIFILATTEFHKLPDTIVSRCLRFNFKPIDPAIAAKHLRHIADSEGLAIDDEALALIAKHGSGSFRDSISQLDQLRGSSGTISLSDVQLALGTAPETQIAALARSIVSGDSLLLLNTLANLYSYGAAPEEIAKQLSRAVREGLIENSSLFDSAAAMRLLQDLLDVQGSPRPKAQLELALLDILFEQTPVAAKPSQIAALPDAPKAPEPIKHAEPAKIQKDKKTQPVPVSGNSPDQYDQAWQLILAALKAKHNTLYSIARMATPEFANEKVVLTFKFAFHHKQINEPKNKDIIADVVYSQLPAIKEIVIKLADKNPGGAAALAGEPSDPDPAISSITNIFGGGEVLKS